MEIVAEKREKTAIGTFKSVAFTVESNAHMMHILSGLYRDPISAMVREYLTNMYDAYVPLLRNNPNAAYTPPVLMVPTHLSPNLVFQDFGIGMSETMLETVFTGYGKSTKSGDNDNVGGFGLGSKTAFCYNGGSGWMVESIHDGYRRVYGAVIGANGVPSFDQMAFPEPTTEPNGTKITIPIRREDMHRIQEAVNKFAPYFPIKLDIQGMNAPKPIQYKDRGAEWGYRAPGQGDDVRVIMGSVPYPMDHDQTMQICVDMKIDRSLYSTPIDFFVPIGAVDLVPSRDGLKYTPRTIAAIKAAITSAIDGFSQVVTTTIASCPTEYAAAAKIREYIYNSTRVIATMIQAVKWHGKVIDHTLLKRDFADLHTRCKTLQIAQYKIASRDKSSIESPPASGQFLLPVGEEKPITVHIFIDDVKRGAVNLIKAHMFQNLVAKGRSGRAVRYGHTPGTSILLSDTKLTVDDVKEICGGYPHVALVSTLSGLAIPNAVKAVNKKYSVYRWNGSRFEARVHRPDTTTDNVYYVPVMSVPGSNAVRSVYNGLSNDNVSFRDMLPYVHALNWHDEKTPIYGVKEADVAALPSNWINLFSELEDNVKKLFADPKVIDARIKRTLASSIGYYPKRIVFKSKFASAVDDYIANNPQYCVPTWYAHYMMALKDLNDWNDAKDVALLSESVDRAMVIVRNRAMDKVRETFDTAVMDGVNKFKKRLQDIGAAAATNGDVLSILFSMLFGSSLSGEGCLLKDLYYSKEDRINAIAADMFARRDAIIKQFVVLRNP